jgi:hypothetical protein
MKSVRNNWRLTGRRKNLERKENMNNVTTIAIATMLAASITFVGCTGTKKTENPDATEATATVTDVGTADDASTTTVDAVPEAVAEPAEAPATETTTEAGN